MHYDCQKFYSQEVDIRGPKNAGKPKLTPGRYRSLEGREVIITHVDGNKAHGRLTDSRDTTWWYADSGEHAVYTPDDLVEKIAR